MSELSDALRQFADRIEQGQILPSATQCAVVLSDDTGKYNATYIGRMAPHNVAGIHLLSCGIQRFNDPANNPNIGGFQATRGSTH